MEATRSPRNIPDASLSNSGPRSNSNDGNFSTVPNDIGPPGDRSPPVDSGPESSSDDASTADDDSYQVWLKAFSNECLHSQLTHHVSLAATNSMWNLAFKYIPKLMELKEKEGITKRIPQFVQVSHPLNTVKISYAINPVGNKCSINSREIPSKLVTL